MKIEKSEIIKKLMKIQENPHSNNIVNSQVDTLINTLIQTDGIECVFAKKAYLRSNLKNKTIIRPENQFGFYQLKETA